MMYTFDNSAFIHIRNLQLGEVSWHGISSYSKESLLRSMTTSAWAG